MLNICKAALIVLLIVLLCAVVVEGVYASMLPGEVMPVTTHAPMIQAARDQSDVARIVRVLKRRIGSHRLPEQAKEKLDRMSEKDLRLVASLCDRLAAAHDSAGTDLALLLAAALIVLS